jgi:hypothetical protein
MRKRDKVAVTAEAACRYVDGYRRAPENTVELRVATATAMPAFASEPWDAEG